MRVIIYNHSRNDSIRIMKTKYEKVAKIILRRFANS